MPERIAIANASHLMILHRIERLSLIEHVYTQINIPPSQSHITVSDRRLLDLFGSTTANTAAR